MEAYTNIGLSLLNGEPVLGGYVENIPDSLSHSALAPASSALGQPLHRVLTGPLGVLGTGDDRCHPIWLWDAINGKVLSFDGATFGELPSIPHRDEYLQSRRDPDPLGEGADTYGSGTAMLFPFYGDMILVMSVIVPVSKVYVMRFIPDTLSWQELTEVNIDELGAAPPAARAVAFSNAVNYRGGVTWLGNDSYIDKLLVFHLNDELEVSVFRHTDPRGFELFKPINTETAQQLKLMPTVKPHLDSLMSAVAHAYSDRDIAQSGVREAAREYLLDHQRAQPVLGLRTVIPSQQMAKDVRVDWPFRNPQGMTPFGDHLFFVNTIGQVCRYNYHNGFVKPLLDIPWSVPEMQQGTFTTDNDGSAIEGDFDFRLANPTPSTTPGFEHDGALPVEYWNSYCRLRIVSIPDTGDPGLNAKFATFIGREGIYSGLEDDKHWVLDLTGRPLFSSYLDPGTGLWERLALPAGTVIDTAYAYGGCIDNELNAQAAINMHLMESGGHLYVMAMPALTRQRQGLVSAIVSSVSCDGDNLEIVLIPSDYVTPLTVTTVSASVVSGPDYSEPDDYSIVDNGTTEVTIRFPVIYVVDEIDIEINGLITGYPNFVINLAAISGCKPVPTASITSAACDGETLKVVIEPDDGVSLVNVLSVAGVVVSGSGGSNPANYTIVDNGTTLVTVEFPELDVGDVLDLDFDGTVDIAAFSLEVNGISGCKVLIDPLLFNVGDVAEASPQTDTINDNDWNPSWSVAPVVSGGFWREPYWVTSDTFIQVPGSYPPLDVVANGEARIELEGQVGVIGNGNVGLQTLFEQVGVWQFVTRRTGSGDISLWFQRPIGSTIWSTLLTDNFANINNPFTVGFKAVDIGGGLMSRHWYFNGTQISSDVVGLSSINTIRVHTHYIDQFGAPRWVAFRNVTNDTSFA